MNIQFYSAKTKGQYLSFDGHGTSKNSATRVSNGSAFRKQFYNLLIVMLATLPAAGVFAQTTLTYSSSTTWVCPIGVTSLKVECWGGGGAGGGATGNPAAGGGGAGGSYARNNTLTVVPGTTYTITVGTGGTGGTGVGGNGNDSWFSSAATVMAKGGPGGAAAASNSQTAAGAAAINSGNVGFTAPAATNSFYGGAGGTGGALGTSGGGGGSSAGTISNGLGAIGIVAGIAVTGGGAGVAGSASSANGASNTNLGGGGAGARAGSVTDRSGGSGGKGQVQITFTQPSCPSSTAVTPVTVASVCVGGTPATLTANITLGGSSGSPTLLYQWYYNTTNSNTVAGATLIAGATGNTYAPSGASAGTRYYFCVGYAANNGCAQTNATQYLASNAVQVVIIAGMTGSFNVGSAGTYTTLTAALNAFNTGCLGGPVTFVLTDASYSGSETFPLTVSNSTTSATNTLTIVPAAGNNATISGSLNSKAILNILSNYVTIDGSNNGSTTRNLVITNTSVSGPSVLLIGSTGTAAINNVTVKNTNIINGTQTASALIISDGTTLGNAGYFNDITIQNNTIQKAYIGLYARAVNTGYNGSGLNLVSNDLSASGANAIRRVGLYVQDVNGAFLSGNSIGNFETASTEFDYGIWFASGTKNSVISNNNIFNLAYTGATNTGPSGIFISTNVPLSDLRVFGNTITGISSTGWVPSGGSGAANGINIDFASSGGEIYNNNISNIRNSNASGYGCNGIQLSATASDAAFNVFNNFVSDIASLGSTSSRSYDRNGHGMVITAGGGYHVYNNTVVMNSNQTNAGYPSAINITSGVTLADAIDLQNNLFINTQTQTGNRYAIQSGASNAVFATIDYNDYYTTGTNVGYIGSDRTNLAAIQAGFGSNTNAKSILPVFVSSTDFHLQAPTVNEALNNSGTPLPAVGLDIDGDYRNPLTPDMGADEFKGTGSWVGGVSSAWTTASNWYDNVIPIATTHIEIANATYMPVISATTQPAANIVIESGGSLTVSGTGSLEIGGKMYSDGTFDVSTGTVEMTGTVPQNIPYNIFQGDYLKNLVISNTDNTTGVTLDGPTDIYRSLSFGVGGRKLTTNGNLTFKSTASETAWLEVMSASNTIVGEATVERYIPNHAKAWQFLSTPTSGQTVNAAWQEGNTPLSTSNGAGYGTIITSNVAGAGFDIVAGNGASMKTYDTTAKAFVGISSTSIPIYNRKGYFIFVRGNRTVTTTSAPATITNLRTKGTLFTPANPPAVISLAANTYESVGNPYPSAVNLTGLNRTGGVQDVFYVWDPKITTAPAVYGVGAFQTFTRNGASYDVTPGGGSYPSGTCNTIQSGQAFMVRAPTTAGSIGFTESAKVSASVNVNRTMPVTTIVSQLRTNLNVITTGNNAVLIDGTLVQFDDNFSNEVDVEDAAKLGNTGENLGMTRNGQLLAVERRGQIQRSDSIFYSLGQLRVQQYQFVFIPKAIAQPDMEAYLEDSYLQTRTNVDLRDTTTIAFSIVNIPGSYAADRFRLVFQQVKKKKTVLVTTVETGKSVAAATTAEEKTKAGMEIAAIKVYPNPVTNKTVHLQFIHQPAGSYSLTLLLPNGMQQKLNTVQVADGNTDKTISLPASIAPGVYRIQVIGPDGNRTIESINVL